MAQASILVEPVSEYEYKCRRRQLQAARQCAAVKKPAANSVRRQEGTKSCTTWAPPRGASGQIPVPVQAAAIAQRQAARQCTAAKKPAADAVRRRIVPALGRSNPHAPGIRDHGNRDPRVRDPGIRDPGIRDPGVRDPGIRDPGIPGTRGQMIRPQAPRTPQAPGIRDPGIRVPGNQDPGIRDPRIPGTRGRMIRPQAPRTPRAPGILGSRIPGTRGRMIRPQAPRTPRAPGIRDPGIPGTRGRMIRPQAPQTHGARRKMNPALGRKLGARRTRGPVSLIRGTATQIRRY